MNKDTKTGRGPDREDLESNHVYPSGRRLFHLYRSNGRNEKCDNQGVGVRVCRVGFIDTRLERYRPRSPTRLVNVSSPFIQ